MVKQGASTRNMGPVIAGTLVVQNIEECVSAYVDWLEMHIAEEGEIGELQANAWSTPSLAGSRYFILKSKSEQSWLRMIENKDCGMAKPISELGWMSLEVLVDDVYILAERLRSSVFEIIGEPKALDVSPAISACQVVGPAGEVLYLTAVAEPVPPFELPTASTMVDKLFIPVLAVPNRDESMAFYEKLANSKALAFDTKVTVVNKSLGKPMDRRIPVCTIQLDAESLIEIDEIVEFSSKPSLDKGLVNGIAMISFYVDSFDLIEGSAVGESYEIENEFYKGKEARLFKGKAGEYLELVKR